MSTIRDVARLAGVSTMTVSRVVNNSGYTSQVARGRVERAIAELGYVPNAVARHLRSNRTKTIALVLSDITNPFFTTIARGVEDVAGPRGFGVMFCNTDESESEERDYLQMLIQRQVDGVLLVPASKSLEPLRLLRAQQVPVVVLDRRVASRVVDQVRTDSVLGAYTLVRHLVDLGHRRIAILTGKRAISTAVDRVAGYERALHEVGVALDSRLVRYGGFGLAGGYRMAQEVLAATPRPTAMFAANNFVGFGALRAIRDAGLRVPDDVSLVCFDDIPEEWVIDPFFTVMDQPAYEMGRQAAELLFERLDGRGSKQPRAIVLPGQLIVRRSTAPPAGATAAA
jgi:LacI family transcriptional regulator